MPERHRILVFIKGLGIGGAETLIANSAPLWNTREFDYQVAFLLPWKDQLQATIESSGFEVRCHPWQGLDRVSAVSGFRRHVSDFAPHIIHSHLPSAGIFARTATPRAIHVYTEHNVVDFYRQPTRAFNRLTYGVNSAVIAVSDAVAKSVSAYPGPPPAVIPNGVILPEPDAARDAEIRSSLGVGPETRLIAHVGNIRPHKGHANLIAAVGLLANRVGDFLVISAGVEKHDGDIARLQRLAEESGAGPHIRFLGMVPNATQLMAAADVVVNPSDVEGLPLSVLEALGLGRVVVATAVGGVPTVLDDGRTGVLVPPGDPQALASGIERALSDPKAGEWSDNGAQLISAEYGIETMVSRYESLYREVLDE